MDELETPTEALQDSSPLGETVESPPDSGEASTGSWPKDVQAEFTKKSQSLADDRRAFEEGRQQWYAQQQQIQQQQIQQQQQQHHLQQQRQQAGGQQTQQNEMLTQLREMQYLDGPTAASLVERIMQEGINPLSQAIHQRDQALAHLYKEYKAVKEGLGQHTTAKAESELSQRFVKLREDHQLPDEPWVNEYLQDVYYSHEGGKDLDAEYSGMVRQRLETMRKGFRDMDRKAAASARTQPSFPAKGGEVAFSDGKTGGYKTPEERTNELWPMLNPGQSE